MISLRGGRLLAHTRNVRPISLLRHTESDMSQSPKLAFRIEGTDCAEEVVAIALSLVLARG